MECWTRRGRVRGTQPHHIEGIALSRKIRITSLSHGTLVIRSERTMTFQSAIVNGIGPIDSAESTLGNVVPIGPGVIFFRPVRFFIFQVEQIASRKVFEARFVAFAIAVFVAVSFGGAIVDGIRPGVSAEFGHVAIESELCRWVGCRR